MIFDALILIATFVLGIIVWVFGAVSTISNGFIPHVTESITWVFGYLNVFGGVLNLPVLMSCVLALLTVYVARYQIKQFFKFIWPMIPYFGSRVINPFEDKIPAANMLDLRGAPKLGKGRNIQRNTRDIR